MVVRADRRTPRREYRSIAELIAGCGVPVAAAAVLIVPGAAGHAAQTSPRGLTLAFDWLHLSAGSIWFGGLIGLLILWATLPPRRRVAALSVVVPRFSNTEMQMPQQEYQLTETRPGVYSRAAPARVMVGKWALSFQITPKGAPPFAALILDQANG